MSAVAALLQAQAQQKTSTTPMSPGSQECCWSFKCTDKKYPAGCVTVSGDVSLEDAYTACAAKNTGMAPFSKLTALSIYSNALEEDLAVSACDASKRKTSDFRCADTFPRKCFKISVTGDT